MRERLPRQQMRGTGAKAADSPAPAVSNTEPQTVRRRWIFRWVAALALPLFALLLAEGMLRVVGYGHPASFFVKHAATGPDLLVENQRFSWRFFPRTLARHPDPLVCSPVKPSGTCRVFVFGESAAEGDPAPEFGFSRILEVLLRERYPGVRFEVVNVAFTAINSRVIVLIARECRRLQGDFWLVYMGNNEVVGPFGAGTILGGRSLPEPLIRGSLALKTTRVGQALDGWVQRWWPSRDARLGWGGMTMFMREQVARHDPRLRQVRQHFRAHLEEIIELGANSGARVLVSTLVSRVRDWPPFASAHRPDLSAAQRADWERWFKQGLDAEVAGDFPAAWASYDQAAQLDDRHAELQYRRGRTCLALARVDEARSWLGSARDLDTLRFRADSELNATIRAAVVSSAAPGLRLVDAESAFARESPYGLPGAEWLYEHVHFNFAGNYLLARQFADAMSLELSTRWPAAAKVAPDWLSAEDCAVRLAYNECQQHEIARQMFRRFDEPIYRNQIGYAARMADLERELAELRGQAKPAARKRALERTRQALAAVPEDWRLRELAARLLGGLDDYAGAIAEWEQVSRRIPHAAGPFIELGKLEFARGGTAPARAWFHQAITVNPDAAEAWQGLGWVNRREGRTAEAERCFRNARRLDPAGNAKGEDPRRAAEP